MGEQEALRQAKGTSTNWPAKVSCSMTCRLMVHAIVLAYSKGDILGHSHRSTRPPRLQRLFNHGHSLTPAHLPRTSNVFLSQQLVKQQAYPSKVHCF
jgi:hypothetical protein